MGKPRVLVLDALNTGARTIASYLKGHLGEDFNVSSHGICLHSEEDRVLNTDHLASFYWLNREALFDALKDEMGINQRQVMAKIHFLKFNSINKLEDGPHFRKLAEEIRKAERG